MCLRDLESDLILVRNGTSWRAVYRGRWVFTDRIQTRRLSMFGSTYRSLGHLIFTQAPFLTRLHPVQAQKTQREHECGVALIVIWDLSECTVDLEMASDRLRSIVPMFGGATSYVETLDAIIE